jgi:hypothetical protein
VAETRPTRYRLSDRTLHQADEIAAWVDGAPPGEPQRVTRSDAIRLAVAYLHAELARAGAEMRYLPFRQQLVELLAELE